MIDFRTMRNEEIIRTVRRKLYNIICEHVKRYDDENAMKHIEMFMDGFSWAVDLRYTVTGTGKVYLYLKCLNWARMELVEIEYKVIDVHLEIKVLRNSINRHYDKIWGVRCHECY